MPCPTYPYPTEHEQPYFLEMCWPLALNCPHEESLNTLPLPYGPPLKPVAGYIRGTMETERSAKTK